MVAVGGSIGPYGARFCFGSRVMSSPFLGSTTLRLQKWLNHDSTFVKKNRTNAKEHLDMRTKNCT